MKQLALRCAALAAALFVYRCLTGTPDAASDTRAHSELPANAAAHSGARARRSALELDAQAAARAPVGVTATATATAAVPLVETLFHGRLIDASGQPLTGASEPTVSLVDAEGRRHKSSALELGAFTFSALPFGKYWVTASAEGYLKATDEIELDSAHAQLAKDYTLASAPILKIRVVTPEGANLFDEGLEGDGRPELAAIATREQPGKWIDQAVGYAGRPFGIGRFLQSGPRVDSLPGGYMGILMLDQELPAFVSLVNRQRVLQTQEIKPGDDVVTFVLDPDELGASLATLRMQLLDHGTPGPFDSPPAWFLGGALLERGLEPDPNGRTLLAGREPGPIELPVSGEVARSRVLANSAATDLGRMELEHELELAIQVVDSTGAARNSTFNLGVCDPLTGTIRMERQVTYVSTGAGELELSGLDRRCYVLRTSPAFLAAPSVLGDAGWVSGNVLLDLRPRSAPTSFVITLTRATRVMLLGPSEPADGLSFRVIDEQGLELESGPFYGSGAHLLALPKGGYTFQLLDASGQVLAEQWRTVGTRPLTIELAP